MTFQEEIAAAKAQTHWAAKQRNHLRRLQKAGAVFAYWLSDAHGRPINHTLDPIKAKEWTAKPGLIQKLNGPLKECSSNALHATFEPHRWKGCRVWVVGFIGEVKHLENKIAGLHREIIGEIMPEEALSPSVGVKLGRKDLYGADLISANLYGADLSYANLYSANLISANLISANLNSANLNYANLSSADLRYADLRYANLNYANLSSADLASANLSSANLNYANLSSADLASANLSSADLTSAKWDRSFPVPNGWKYKGDTNILERA